MENDNSASDTAQQNKDGSWSRAAPVTLPLWYRIMWRIGGIYWIRLVEWWDWNIMPRLEWLKETASTLWKRCFTRG